VTVKVVTDSVSDLPLEIAQELGITVIPLYIHFGSKTYKNGVALTTDEFYHKLETSSTLPKTSAPGAGVFTETFDKLAEETDEILAIVASPKFSATYEVALQGLKLMRKKCQVEVADSTLGIMGEGLLVIEAAKKALSGSSLDEIRDEVYQTAKLIHVRMSFDTLKYLAIGGRIGKAQALLGSMLKVNPILGIKDGEAFPFARERSRAKAIEWLYKFATSFTNVKALAVEDATTPDEAEMLVKRLSSKFPKAHIYRSKVSPVVGAHVGPRVLAVSILEGKSS